MEVIVLVGFNGGKQASQNISVFGRILKIVYTCRKTHVDWTLNYRGSLILKIFALVTLNQQTYIPESIDTYSLH